MHCLKHSPSETTANPTDFLLEYTAGSASSLTSHADERKGGGYSVGMLEPAHTTAFGSQ